MNTPSIPEALARKIFVPDGSAVGTALQRTTHLGVGAHQDDLEFMALHGVLECFGKDDRWFSGITCTDGAGSARTGLYADCTDADMQTIRHREQNVAATIGQYSFMAQLGYPSSTVKQREPQNLIDELVALLKASRPKIVYTHNPADKHASHLGVFSALLKALRTLPKAERPEKLIGCEVWRNLDWLCDGKKVLMDVSAHGNVSAALNGVFDSQITGGKRYDLAVTGRRRANATFLDSHSIDNAQELICGIDITALIEDDQLSPIVFVKAAIEDFSKAAEKALSPFFGA